ncbi:ribosomal s5 domain 2-type fold [Trichoderma arundinaceum]|uniref:Ribosomal s5 domain 2-type fold n=1 Tax=Trichoderma arundinaceum TaxID=490622 RepID=A0A395NFJ0_TRIAR|nr:ribosomal s5 domain 2-type fold [Trichoderma arundinaceum]
MAGHGDLQEMLRMLTARKASMMAAMGYIRALQSKNLKRRETGAIAEAPSSAIEEAISDAKLAKSFHTACKSHGKKSNKRAAEEPASAERKKPKLEMHKRDLDYNSMTPEELEGSLTLPLCEDEELMKETTLVTNRAPLVLAFAVELLRFTMPEQPPSSRLSLAQAVVSANSRSKAISIGIEKAPAGGEAPIPTGQPRVSVLGREIPVLKRGDYVWSESSDKSQSSSTTAGKPSTSSSSSSARTSTTFDTVWATSKQLASKGSVFVAHAAPIKSPSMRQGLMKILFNKYPDLEKTADHVAWAIRTSFGGSSLVQEASFDDGEAGCGKFMLELLREANITNTTVVLARWYGGVMLGPDRWRLMRECLNDALSAQQRTSTFSGEALWGLDAEDKKPAISTIGMAIHRPEGARNYLLRSFASAGASDGGGGKKTVAALNDEKQENLGRLLGALRLLFASWAGVLGRGELDRRAWSWYVAIRPDIEAGPSGWGEKGTLKLSKILDLRRKEALPAD